MSERGSFVTEYCHCRKCLEVLKDVLIGNEKYLCSQQIKSWVEKHSDMPIIAGKIGGLYSGEEIDTFEYEFIPKIRERICHKVTIAVISEMGGSKIFEIEPVKEGNT